MFIVPTRRRHRHRVFIFNFVREKSTIIFFNYCILGVKSTNFKILAISRVNKHFFATKFYVIPFETDWSHVAACTAAASEQNT